MIHVKCECGKGMMYVGNKKPENVPLCPACVLKIEEREARKYYVYWHKDNSRDWFKGNPPTREELSWDYECHIVW